MSQLRGLLDELENQIDGHSGDAAEIERELNLLGQTIRGLTERCRGFADSDDPSSQTDGGPTRESNGRRRSRERVRIQLKLSSELVRVLQTVRGAGVKASELVETVMWEAPRVRDTAKLARIPRPRRRRSA